MAFKSSFVDSKFESSFTEGFKSSFAEDEETPVGDILTSAGAGLAAGFTAPGRFAGAGLEVIEDITGINLPGEQLTDISNFAQKFWQKRIGKTKSERLVGQATEAIGTIGATLGVIAGTGGLFGAGGATTFAGGAKAAAGSQALLLSLSAGAGLDKTATERRQGQPVLNAYGAGVVTAATEYLTEKLPLGQLQNIGNKFFRRLATGAVQDIGGEMLATAVELSVVDKRILNKDHHLTTDQYFDIMKETAAVALISTVGLSAGAKGLQLVSDSVDANNSVSPPKNPLILPQQEKVETVAPVERVDSKSEFPELSGQTDPTSPEVNVELNPVTTELAEVDNTQPIEPVTTPYEDTLLESEAYSLRKRKLTGDKIWKSFVKSWVDVSGNLQSKLSKLGNDGKRVVMRQNAIGGASARAIKQIDIINKDVYSGLSKNERRLFDGYKSALRDLELRRSRGKKFKIRGGHTEQSVQDFLDRIPAHYLEDPTHPEGKGEFVLRSEAFNRHMDDLLVLMQKEQLLTEEQVTRLQAEGREYVPRQVLDFIDPEIQRQDSAGKRITVRDSGLKNLTEDGSERLLETDTELLMEQAQQRAWTRIYRNRAALEMQRLARTNKDAASIVRENTIDEFTNEVYKYTNEKGKDVEISVKDELELNKKLKDRDVSNIRKVKNAIPIFKKVSPNEMTISVLEDGVRKELVMPVELGSEWITGDPILSATMSNIISWASGNKVLRAMATTLNPEFAITNVLRDLSHIWMVTEEYSSFAPLAALQMAGDIAAVATNFNKWNDIYVDNGGGMEWLSIQGLFRLKGDSAVTRGMSALEGGMSKIGTVSEKLTRFALTRRAMRNKNTEFEATQIARGQLDFARGGSLSKALNSAIPFLNAGIQATRGILRASKNNPMVFGAKAFQVGAIAAGLYYANKESYPEDWENVPDNDKENNFIFLTPYTFVDSNGRQRRRYIRIPKDQGQKVFSMIFENMARRSEGEQVDAIKISNVVKDYLPIVPGEILPPALEMTLGYAVNKDFWTREDIWQGDPVIPQEEYNKYTPEFFVQAGRVTGSSPERLRYATRQLFTNGNVWTSAVGYGVEEVLNALTPEQRERISERTLDDLPGVRRLMRSTKPDLALSKEVERQKIEINTERLRRNRELDALSARFFAGNTDIEEVNDYLRRTPQPEKKRLQRRFKAQRMLQGVTNRGFWFDLLDLPPEQRAVNYWNEWSQLDDDGKREMNRQSRKVPGFRSKRFDRTFNKMRKFGEQAGR